MFGIKREYKYLVSYVYGNGRSSGTGRSFVKTDIKINTEARVQEIEKEMCELNDFGKLLVTNIVRLKR